MLLVLELGMLVAGVIAFFSGKFKLTRNRVAKGTAARVAGIVLLLPVPLAFTAGFVLGLKQAAQHKPLTAPDFKAALLLVELLLVGSGLFVALMIALAFAERPRDRRVARFQKSLATWNATADIPMLEVVAEPETLPALPLTEFDERPPSSPHGIVVAPTEQAADPRWPLAAPPEKPRKVAKRRKDSVALVVAAVLIGITLPALGILNAFAVIAPADKSVTPGLFVAPPTPEELARQKQEAERWRLEFDRRERAEALRMREQLDERQKKFDALLLERAKQREEEERQARERFDREAREDRERQQLEQARRDEQTRRELLGKLAKPLAAVPLPRAQQRATGAVPRWQKDINHSSALLTFERQANQPQPNQQANVVGAAWVAEGGAILSLTRSGLLQRLGYPDLKEQLRLDLKQECTGLAVCKYGLLLTLEQLQELWLVNPETFDVVRRFGVGQLLKAHTGPNLDVAYVFSRVSDKPWGKSSLPFQVNLKDGSIAALTVEGGQDAALPPGWTTWLDAVVSPDGKWLIADSRKLLRYCINGTVLSLVERTQEDLGSGKKHGICLSPDGQWVCSPSGGGLSRIGYATHVYRTADLSRPAFLLKFEAYPQLVGFDPVGQRLFSQSREGALLLFDENGTKRGEYKLPILRGFSEVRQYVAHPTNRRSLLVRTNDALTLVEIAAPE